jgi:hypothetical protein
MHLSCKIELIYLKFKYDFCETPMFQTRPKALKHITFPLFFFETIFPLFVIKKKDELGLPVIPSHGTCQLQIPIVRYS